MEPGVPGPPAPVKNTLELMKNNSVIFDFCIDSCYWYLVHLCVPMECSMQLERHFLEQEDLEQEERRREGGGRVKDLRTLCYCTCMQVCR